MKRILFITHQFSLSGAPIVLLGLIGLIKKSGYDAEVISMREGPLSGKLEEMGIPWKIRSDFMEDWESFYREALTFDAVVVNTLVAYPAIRILNRTKIPTLWWLHESKEYFDDYEKMREIVPDLSTLSPNIRLYAVGERVQREVLSRFCVQTGLLPFILPDPGERKEKASGEPIRFLMLGEYSKRKGMDLFYEAIRSLPEEVRAKCRFTAHGTEILGEEGMKEDLRKYAEDLPNVVFGDALSHDDAMKLLSEADFCLIPSRFDAMPTVAAEAMGFGVCCVISDACGITACLTDDKNALIFPCGEKEAFAGRILDAVSLYENRPEAYRSLQEEAKTVFDRRFSEKTIGADFLRLMKNMSEHKRLIFVTGQIDILDIFTYEMMPEFQRLGYETFELKLSMEAPDLTAFLDFVKGGVTAAFVYNHYGLNFSVIPGKNTWESLKIPVVDILMDHPYCHRDGLLYAPENTVVLCVDRNHMNYVARFHRKFQTVGFLPHGGLYDGLPKKPLKDREITILYAGGLSRDSIDKIRPDLTQFSFDAETVVNRTVERTIQDPSRTMESVMEEVLLEMGITLPEEELCRVIAELHYADLLIVSHYRELVLKTLALSGLPLRLYGVGWENLSWVKDCANVDYRGRVDAWEIVREMGNAKIVLSTHTWFKDGTHDRIFNGMLQRAVVVSDSSLYMKESFSDEELIQFELTEIPGLPDRIKELLDQPERMQKIADNGYLRAIESESHQARARELDRDLLPYL